MPVVAHDSQAERTLGLALAALLLGGCASPALTVPSPPDTMEPTALFVEDFDDEDYSAFELSDPQGAGRELARSERFVSDRRGGFLLERRMTGSLTDGFESLMTVAAAPIDHLEQAASIELSVIFSINNLEEGDGSFGIGVGGDRFSGPGYFAFVNQGFETSVLALTRNSASFEPRQGFAPVAAEFRLELSVARSSGQIVARLRREGTTGLIAEASFVDPAPLRPDHLYFFSTLQSSSDSFFTVDEIMLVGN